MTLELSVTLVPKRQNRLVSSGYQEGLNSPCNPRPPLLHLPQQLLAICSVALSPQRAGRQSLSSQQSSQGANQKEDLERGKLLLLALSSAGGTGLERGELGVWQQFLNNKLGPMP